MAPLKSSPMPYYSPLPARQNTEVNISLCPKSSPMPSYPRLPACQNAEVSISWTSTPCVEDEYPCATLHPHILPRYADVKLTAEGDRSIGHVKFAVLQKAAMEAISPGTMWEECKAFDAGHYGAGLNKIEAFLANEPFEPDKDRLLVEAREVVFIEAVYLKHSMRRRGLGLEALSKVITGLHLEGPTVVMLQAGSVGDHDGTDATEKLERHWAKIGFQPWSYSDDPWLLRLAEARPGKIQLGWAWPGTYVPDKTLS